MNELRRTNLNDIAFANITPDAKNNWLNQSNSDFERLMLLAHRESKGARTANDRQAVFGNYSMAVATNRDAWVYDFDVATLRDKALFFADTYNGFIDSRQEPNNPVIKWSRDLRNEFHRGRRVIYSEANRIRSLYRPFVAKHHFADFTMNDVLTRNHYEMFGADLHQSNQVINFCVNGRHFYVLGSDKLTDLHFTGDTQCLPLYRYTADGERVSNVTEWGLRRINEHYREEWGAYFDEAYPDGITAEDVFAYTYAVLHDPVYRYDYRVDLLREFPRLPLYHDFAVWARMGRELLDLHLGFETAEPYPLERVDKDSPATSSAQAVKALLRADKERGVITLDEQTTLTGVPEAAWRYQLGSRSALEWVLDQYKEKKPRDPTIRERFNTYRFVDYKEQVIDLLRRVCSVSVKTIAVVDGMAYWDEGNLIVFGDRDQHEWSMLGLQAMYSRHEDEDWEAAWSET